MNASRMTLTTSRLMRIAGIATLLALTITLAPIARADTVRFVRLIFGAPPPAAVVKADLTH